MLDRVSQILEDGIRSGFHLGAQIYISRDFETVADFAIGQSRIGVPMTRDTLNLWMSAVKPVAAIAIAQLVERGLLDFEDAVARHIPEFAANGKDAVTIAHLLTHTGGFRLLPDASMSLPYDDIIQNICAMRLEPRWIPGERAGYHARSSWMILGEVIHRADGRTFDVYAREEIFRPLRMNDSWVGIPFERYMEYGDRIGATFNTANGAVSSDSPMLGVPSAELCARVQPASNGRGPIRELARLYEMLLNGGELDGVRILKTESVETITSPRRVGMFDETFKRNIDWGYGFFVNNAREEGGDAVPYGYGDFASRETFGHSGALSSCAFCDPVQQLVVAWVCNGMPSDAMHQMRARSINNAIYQDLGLA